MSANYVLLERITVGAAGASSVTFSGIPQTGYTDLVIKYTGRANDNGAADGFAVQFNGSTTSFSGKTLYGSGSAALSASPTDRLAVINGTGSTANTFANGEVYIPNYTSSNYKSYSIDVVTENNATEVATQLAAGLWSNTAAITSITLVDSGKTILQYSTFYLYGVAKLGTTPAIVPYATGGDTIMTDGSYWYHAFRSSGTFTPTQSLTADVLVVAGGGGTSGGVSGGAGAGGLLAHTSQSLTAIGYTVTVGAGGGSAANGSNSQFASLTASVGGGLGAGSGSNSGNGGSGGGQPAPGSTSAGTGTAGQGNNGGAKGSNYSGGGGGSTAAGGTGGANSRGGDGGAGSNAYSTWATVTATGASGSYAGGGGGSAWNGVTSNNTGGNAGAGGGGAGGEGGAGSAQATNGVANTGGGAGGDNNSGKTGGSGIVIVRYAV